MITRAGAGARSEGRPRKGELLEGRCERHQFDRAVDRCGRCGGEFCATCVVYSFGPKKPPFCLPCAVTAAGVRTKAAKVPALSRKERKRLEKERLVNLAHDQPAAEPIKAPVEVEWFDGAAALSD
jgi:hypothetical protein